MSVFKKILLSTVLVVSAFILTVGAFSVIVQAQMENLPQWAQDRIMEQVKSVSPESIAQPPIEEMLFTSGVAGCADKLNFTFIMAMGFMEGAPLSDIAPHPEVIEYAQGYFEGFREEGVGEVSYQALQDFDQCVEKNTDDNTKASSIRTQQCADLNGVVLETLSTLENRRSIDPIVTRLERSPLDLSETHYAGSSDRIYMMLGNMSRIAGDGSVDSLNGARYVGLTQVVGCMM